MIRSEQQVTKVTTVQQGVPIPFVAMDKPEQSLIGGKTQASATTKEELRQSLTIALN